MRRSIRKLEVCELPKSFEGIAIQHGKKRIMPVQKPGNSKQDYGTPESFIRAVTNRFGNIDVDLAATYENTKAPVWLTPEKDSLTFDWMKFDQGSRFPGARCWLNPPFAHITPWAQKCKEEAARGAHILFLTPASVGSEWFAKHVWGHAKVYALRPRLVFVGETTPYPKDLILSYFRPNAGEHFELWKWNASQV